VDESEKLIARAALSSPEKAVAAWDEWKRTNDIRQASNLLGWAGGYIYKNLARANVSEPYLAGIYRHNWLLNNLRFAKASKMIEALQQRWQIVPLKSFALSEETYSRGFRPVADFDFYCDLKDLPEVCAFLEEQGFASQLSPTPSEFQNRIVLQRGSWNFRNSEKTDFDAHWRVFEHLSIKQNRRIVKQSTIRDSANGGHKLNNATMLVALAVNYALQGEARFNGLFDFYELSLHVDPKQAARVARLANATQPMLNLVREIIDFEPRDNTVCVALERELLATMPKGSTELREESAKRFWHWPNDATQYSLIRNKWLYALWRFAGSLGSVEKSLINKLGPFSTTIVKRGEQINENGSNLGPGWHYRYPEQNLRWAECEDARVAFEVETAKPLEVTLDLAEVEWQHSPQSSFYVFANGNPIGKCTKEQSSYSFLIAEGSSSNRLEISLRPHNLKKFLNVGVHRKWYRLMAPVVSLQVKPAG
jgi:hypothetical protein